MTSTLPSTLLAAISEIAGTRMATAPASISTPPSSTSHSQWLPKIEIVCRRSFEPVVELMANLRVR